MAAFGLEKYKKSAGVELFFHKKKAIRWMYLRAMAAFFAVSCNYRAEWLLAEEKRKCAEEALAAERRKNQNLEPIQTNTDNLVDVENCGTLQLPLVPGIQGIALDPGVFLKKPTNPIIETIMPEVVSDVYSKVEEGVKGETDVAGEFEILIKQAVNAYNTSAVKDDEKVTCSSISLKGVSRVLDKLFNKNANPFTPKGMNDLVRGEIKGGKEGLKGFYDYLKQNYHQQNRCEILYISNYTATPTRCGYPGINVIMGYINPGDGKQHNIELQFLLMEMAHPKHEYGHALYKLLRYLQEKRFLKPDLFYFYIELLKASREMYTLYIDAYNAGGAVDKNEEAKLGKTWVALVEKAARLCPKEDVAFASIIYGVKKSIKKKDWYTSDDDLAFAV